ncbi:MAG: hypothetical protein EOP48_00980 [Sphingobacteriales bacterium]|nr:MAG: hypothetical protein EOP48_00980 [Sphingobacteriales bacterium]
MKHSELKAEVVLINNSEVCSVKVINSIDEYFKWKDISEFLRPTLRIDLSNVGRITSMGIREWAQRPACPFPGRKTSLINAPDCFIREGFMVPVLMTGTELESFELQYQCEGSSQHDCTFHFDVNDEHFRDYVDRISKYICEEDGCGSHIDGLQNKMLFEFIEKHLLAVR